MENDKITKAVAYYRVSSDKQVLNGNGLDTQQWACESWARRNGCKIEHFYTDAAKTGTKTTGRDGLEKMLKSLSPPKEPHIPLFYDVRQNGLNL